MHKTESFNFSVQCAHAVSAYGNRMTAIKNVKEHFIVCRCGTNIHSIHKKLAWMHYGEHLMEEMNKLNA